MTVDAESALLCLAFGILPFSLGLLVVKVVHTLVARRVFFSRDAGGPARGAEMMALSLSTGLPIYAFFFWVGFDMDGATGACDKGAWSALPGGPPHGDVRLVETGLPLSRDCRWPDGTHLELVPLWVNVLLFAAIAGTLAGAALLARGSLRRPRGAGAPAPDPAV